MSTQFVERVRMPIKIQFGFIFASKLKNEALTSLLRTKWVKSIVYVGDSKFFVAFIRNLGGE